MRHPPLREQIARAESVAEVNRLVEIAKTFDFASQRTRNRIHNTAQRRLVALRNGKAEAK